MRVEDDDKTYIARLVTVSAMIVDGNEDEDDASGYEEEAEAVLKMEKSDEDPDEVEELKVDSDVDRGRLEGG